MTHKSVLLSGSILAATLAAAPVWAQEAPAEEGARRLDEITVTAQRREQALQDVPVSVAAFNSESLERLNARTIQDLAGQVPTLTISPVAVGPGLAQISLRGINSQDPEKSFDPAVGVFVDGVYLGTNAANMLDAFDLESIEVLRGPQGTLFGRNTTGGAINAVRTRPTGELGVKASITVGTAGRADWRFVGNAPVIEDTLAVKIAAFRQKDDGIFKNVTPGGPKGARDSTALSVSVLYTPVERFEALFTYDRVEDDSELPPYTPRYIAGSTPAPARVLGGQPGVPAGTTALQPGDRLCQLMNRCFPGVAANAQAGGPHGYVWELDAYTLNMSYRFDNFEIISITGERKAPEQVIIDFDALPETIFHARRDQDYYQFSQELRLVSDLEGPFNFVAGAYYFRSKYTLNSSNVFDGAALPAFARSFQTLIPLVAGGLGPFAGIPAAARPGLAAALTAQTTQLGNGYLVGGGNGTFHTSQTTAVYAQGDYVFGDRKQFTLTGGLRWSNDEKAITQIIFGNLPGDFIYPVINAPILRRQPFDFRTGNVPNKPVTAFGSGAAEWDEWTPKVSLSWRLDDLRMAYASWTQGYNAGGFSGRAGTVLAATTPYQPEKVTAYEVGLKSEWFERRFRANFAWFWNDYQDKQEEIIVPIPVNPFTSTQVQNVSAATIWGVEADFNVLWTDDLTLNASIGYLNAEYDSFQAPLDATLVSPWFSGAGTVPPTLVRADLTGLKLRRTPQLTLSVQPVYDREFAWGRLTAKATARYQSDNYGEFWNDPRGLIKARTLVDVSVGIEFGGPEKDWFKLTAFSNNVTDERGPNSFVRAAATRSDSTPNGEGFLAISGMTPPRIVGLEFQVKY